MTKSTHQKIIAFSLSSLALFSACLPTSSLAAVAGRFQFVAGDVRVTNIEGKERPAIKGGEVHEKESILSGKTGSAQLRMVDDGIVAVRPETTLRIDEYQLAGTDGGSERGFFSLVRGGFRSITGLIGKSRKDNYGIKTPSATIGIRGTDHETIHIATGQPNLPEGTYNKVNTGSTSVNGTPVGANQVGYTPNLNSPATILPNIPPIFDAPKGGQQSKEDRKRDGDKSNSKQQNKDEKQQDKDKKNQDRQKSGSGSAPPDGTAPPPDGTAPPPTGGISPTGNFTSTTDAIAPPPVGTAPPPPTIGGENTTQAPIGSGIVGGDITQMGSGFYAGGGSMVIVDDTKQIIVFDNTTKLPILVAEDQGNGMGFKYSAGTAQMKDFGVTSVGTAKIFWGRYEGAGDQFSDPNGSRDPTTMNLMITNQAMSFLDASSYLPGFLNGGSHTYNVVSGVGNIVDELGQAYTINSSTIILSGSAGTPMALNVNTSTVAGSISPRNWVMQYAGNLQNFYHVGCTTPPCGLGLSSGTLTLFGGATHSLAGLGNASGLFIGPNAEGIMSVFTVNKSGIAHLIGTVLHTK